MADTNITAPFNLAAGIIFPPLCTIIVCLRFYVRCKQDITVGWDDWFTIPALVSIKHIQRHTYYINIFLQVLLIGMSAATLRGKQPMPFLLDLVISHQISFRCRLACGGMSNDYDTSFNRS